MTTWCALGPWNNEGGPKDPDTDPKNPPSGGKGNGELGGETTPPKK